MRTIDQNGTTVDHSQSHCLSPSSPSLDRLLHDIVTHTTIEMSAPIKRAKRVAHYRQQIDWVTLFEQLQNGRAGTAIAAENPAVNVKTLHRWHRAWCEAKRTGDPVALARSEGKVDGRRYNNTALSEADETEVAARLRAAKRDGEVVTRAQLVKAVMDLWLERNPHATRGIAPFRCSPQFVTRFRRRDGFSTTAHKLRRQGPAQRANEDSKVDAACEYLERVQTAVDQYGPHNVVNADETAAHGVQHSRSSWGIVGHPNTVNTTHSNKDTIPTMPAVSAAGDRPPMQVLVKGKTQLAVRNKHLPSSTAGYPTPSGWQTSSSMVQYIDDTPSSKGQSMQSTRWVSSTKRYPLEAKKTWSWRRSHVASSCVACLRTTSMVQSSSAKRISLETVESLYL